VDRFGTRLRLVSPPHQTVKTLPSPPNTCPSLERCPGCTRHCQTAASRHCFACESDGFRSDPA
jgi:hypothetical protein